MIEKEETRRIQAMQSANRDFYLGHLKEFTEISNQYMQNNRTNYTVLINLNETNPQQVQYQLDKNKIYRIKIKRCFIIYSNLIL